MKKCNKSSSNHYIIFLLRLDRISCNLSVSNSSMELLKSDMKPQFKAVMHTNLEILKAQLQSFNVLTWV